MKSADGSNLQPEGVRESVSSPRWVREGVGGDSPSEEGVHSEKS